MPTTSANKGDSQKSTRSWSRVSTRQHYITGRPILTDSLRGFVAAANTNRKWTPASSGTSFSSVQSSTGKTLGMTSAISLAGPTAEDIRKTEELRKAMEPFDVFENNAELGQRVDVLCKLNVLVKRWVRDISVAKQNVSVELAEKLGGNINTFGSYRLGVHNKGADIDALFVAPRNIDRMDYFGSFFELLKRQPGVTQCHAIEEAFVPVIKMNFDGIEIDLLFARLALKEIPEDLDLSDDTLLKNLDAKSVRSMNGCRVTDEILRQVPNVENFRLALRAIKLWAKNHGIYSNSMGFFGGVTWAMLMARTCQLYPNAAPATLVHKFFLVFSRWQWPQPVLLKQPDNVNLGFQVWDPRINLQDRYHLMPIITPAYPQQNSTFNVSSSTQKVLQTEINRGLEIMEEVASGKVGWEKLFETPPFFSKYRHFIVLMANSDSAEDHLEWCGLVESKIRHLVQGLERTPHVKLAHVNPKSFGQNQANGSLWFIGMEFERTENLNLDLTESIQNFQDIIYKQAMHIKVLKSGMRIDAQYVRRKQLGQFLDADLLKRERKSSDSSSSSSPSDGTKRKRPTSESSSGSSSSSSKKRRSNSGRSES